ncbi:MAG: HlyD family efflux transporter periplasmic adaptor subunit [Prevotellaceae bacterium]|jgi:HlyD family secretion protein|nr:HlyD family efflux transporter periplasmic adaptor subunit [Prevotellaceae bacterium]
MKTKNIFILIASAALASACGGNGNKFDASGMFEATEILVSAKGNGEIMRFDVHEGKSVEALTALGFIDTTQLYLRKQQLLANIRALGSRTLNVAQQTAALQQQVATQRREQRRFENLVKQNAATQKQLDDVCAQLETLEKQLAAQTETLHNNNSSLAGERDALAQQVAQLDDQLKNAVIRSPIAGTVLNKYAEEGELAAQGRALFKVADVQRMTLRAYISASQLTTLKIGQTVRVFSDLGAADRREYSGAVAWIADKAEFTPKTIQTRDERANLVYAVKVAVENDGLLKIGMYGEIKFESEK